MRHTVKYWLAVCAAVLASALTQVRAEETRPPLRANIELDVGMFLGGMDEFVHEKGENHELSRLEWDENFVPYVDLRGEFEFWNFFVAASVITSIPVKSGQMRDYDYMLADSTAVSHYSQHEAFFDKHLEVHPEIGGGIYLRNWYIGVSAGFLYRNRKWSAMNGYTQYPAKGEAWSASLPQKEQVGTVITYEEILWAPETTLYVDYTLNEHFTLSLAGTWYQYLHVNTIDTHVLRLTRFEDEMKGGNGVLAEIGILYRPKTSDIIGFRTAFGYEGMFPVRGTSDKGGIGSNAWYGDSSNVQSQMRSNLFWVSFGLAIDPAKMFNLR